MPGLCQNVYTRFAAKNVKIASNRSLLSQLYSKETIKRMRNLYSHRKNLLVAFDLKTFDVSI